MKKAFLSLLTMIYMTVSSGMAMDIHFCMGERIGTHLYANSGNTCGRCGMKEKKGGCCSNEQQFIKLSDDHKASSAQHINTIPFDLLSPVHHLYIRSILFYYKAPLRTQTFADSGPPLYLTNRVFRI